MALEMISALTIRGGSRTAHQVTGPPRRGWNGKGHCPLRVQEDPSHVIAIRVGKLRDSVNPSPRR